jgi:hypothetical protein
MDITIPVACFAAGAALAIATAAIGVPLTVITLAIAFGVCAGVSLVRV